MWVPIWSLQYIPSLESILIVLNGFQTFVGGWVGHVCQNRCHVPGSVCKSVTVTVDVIPKYACNLNDCNITLLSNLALHHPL